MKMGSFHAIDDCMAVSPLVQSSLDRQVGVTNNFFLSFRAKIRVFGYYQVKYLLFKLIPLF